MLRGLRELVPCNEAGYNEVDMKRGTALVIMDPDDRRYDGVHATLERVAHQHPVITRNRAGDLGTHAISDFLTVRQFHRLELYQDLYRKIGAEDQIAFGLPGPVVIGIAFNRDRRSFSARDRELLETIRPHLAQAYRHARSRGRARALVRALEDGLEVAGGAVILLDEDRNLAYAPVAARELISAYYGTWTGLPPDLAHWAASRPGSRPLLVDGPRGRLVVRLLADGADDGQPILLLEESRRRSPTVAELTALGITHREAEVLRLVALGRTNSEIADDLAVTVPTVRKHLERVYSKLGVHSRVDAAKRALGV